MVALFPAADVLSSSITAGDAGIVLSRFLPSIDEPGTGLDVVAEVRASRGVVVVDERAVFVIGFSTSFVELAVAFLFPVDRLLVAGRRVEVVAIFESPDLDDIDGANDARLAAPETIGLLFSEGGLTGFFLPSSRELKDGRDLCVLAEAMFPAA